MATLTTTMMTIGGVGAEGGADADAIRPDDN